ncbi:MAG: DUF420 domain-containing protein [Myxococcales bacterium]|nr:DUF420 domain-containing protein [Myxococcales bacterium]
MSTETQDRGFVAFSGVVSFAVLAFLSWLLFVRQGGAGHANLSFIPALNATLNAIAAALLIAGWRAIRGGNRALHKRLMVSAFGVSLLFLAGYVVYHYAHGDTHYTGVGPIRAVYFTILISHIVLSAALLPLVLVTFYFALRGRYRAHRRIARFTLPVWLYVSITGVVIFFMLRAAGA